MDLCRSLKEMRLFHINASGISGGVWHIDLENGRILFLTNKKEN
jgi:hypothetical protein